MALSQFEFEIAVTRGLNRRNRPMRSFRLSSGTPSVGGPADLKIVGAVISCDAEPCAGSLDLELIAQRASETL
jgi:hypothetical protein